MLRGPRKGRGGLPLHPTDPGRGRAPYGRDGLRQRPFGRTRACRGGRPPRPHLPARDRPPRRCLDAGSHRPRVPKSSHARAAGTHAGSSLNPVRLAFAGTPAFAATILRGLTNSDHEVGLVISQPDRQRGRGRKLLTTPVARLAREEELTLRQPERIGEVAGEISAHDALVVAAYGQILRPDTLYAAPLGAWNVHASLLPRYRGAAPIERAIMAGERETGVSIMRMDEGLDTGPVALQYRTPITIDMTGGELTQVLAELGGKAIVEGMSKLEENSLTLSEQDSLNATYAAKLEDEERVIRWGERVEQVHDLIRALTPHIGARTFHPEVEGPIRVLRSRIFRSGLPHSKPGTILPAKEQLLVECGKGILKLVELQMPGGRALEADDFLRGRHLEGRFSS